MNSMEKVPIKELFNIEKGTLQSLKNVEGDYTFVTASEEWKTHKSFTHDCEALIFAMGAGGSLGRTHYFKGKFIASDLCFILTPKDSKKYPLNLHYYALYFNFIREKIVADLAMGMSKKAINKTNFSKYLIPYIPLGAQDELARKGTALQQRIEEVEEHTNIIKVKVNFLLKKMLAEGVSEKPLNSSASSSDGSANIHDVIQQATALIVRRFQRGEMVIAKVLYLAQAVYKIPLGINFTQQKFGPYDPAIREAIREGFSDKKRFFIRRGSVGREVLALGSNADYLLTHTNHELKQKMNSYLDNLMPHFYAYDSETIERLATICKIIEDERTTDEKVIIKKLGNWKPNKFNDADINRTIAFIKKNNWDKKLLA